MSDLVSSILQSNTGTSSTQSQSELLVQAYKNSRQSEVDALNNKKTDLQNRQNFFSTLRTKIDALISNIDIFQAQNTNSKFVTRSSTSSDTSVLTATASSDASIGVNAIKVDKLASSDILASDRFAIGGLTSLSPGVYNFSINGISGSVTLTTDDTTKDKVAQKFVNAINLNSDMKVTASYINIDGTNSKITLTSKTTGADNDIQFTDSSILSEFGITNSAVQPHTLTRTAATDLTAGFKETDYNNLNSKFNINGINLTRDTNSITDALPGITLNLLKPQASADMAVTLTTSVDQTSVENFIQPLIDSYNDLLKFVKQDNSILRGDSSVYSLSSNLRSITSQAVSSIPNGDPRYITDLGIKINSDGTLSISDKTRLGDLLKQDPQKVANVFTASDGFVTKLNNVIGNLGGSNGLIVARNKSLSQQIDSTDKRTVTLQASIDKQADIMRKEYESMLSVYLQAQNQLTTLNAFNGTTSSSSSSSSYTG